jgi:hypothetical protein
VAALGFFPRISSGMSRPRRIFAYWALAAVLVLELMIPLNYVAGRRYGVFDWTEGKLHSLSERTVKVLTRVEKPLYVTTIFLQKDPYQGSVYNVVHDLLEQYKAANPHIVIENVDPTRERERMQILIRKLDIKDVSDVGRVVFQYGDARKDVSWFELVRQEQMPGEEGAPPEEKPGEWAFRGEEAFTSAIWQVTESRRPQLYFTTGHGEPNVDMEMPAIATALRRDNYQLEKLPDLSRGVPDNCSELLIIDPRTSLTDDETSALRKYLMQGGKLFVAVSGGPSINLEPVLGEYGINMGRDIIIDYSTGRNTFTVPVGAVGSHDIVRDISDFAFRFTITRSVEPLPSPPGSPPENYPHPYALLVTGKSCWAETDLTDIAKGKPPVFDKKTDRVGPLGVAVLYERPDRMPDGRALPPNLPRTRIVAVGSGDFMRQQRYGYVVEPPPEGNVLFFFNAVNWLAEKEELISIPAKKFDVRVLDKMTDRASNVIFWITSAGIPAFFLIVGSVIWLVRRNS